ncbi:hypothetical protein SKAU_G00322450 [Synaphobranchus kaupii]|uniref:Uncharacterized protein n=1 Tax=Synaphobranchus kaupii TaxID=118154 RepID=A0A9Q1IJP3_SYNKA|nr:hypothetical protein SKAU_G00322450 [Synaphobranchus kaupii]
MHRDYCAEVIDKQQQGQTDKGPLQVAMGIGRDSAGPGGLLFLFSSLLFIRMVEGQVQVGMSVMTERIRQDPGDVEVSLNTGV